VPITLQGRNSLALLAKADLPSSAATTSPSKRDLDRVPNARFQQETIAWPKTQPILLAHEPRRSTFPELEA
jgi:hypothetical protein